MPLLDSLDLDRVLDPLRYLGVFTAAATVLWLGRYYVKRLTRPPLPPGPPRSWLPYVGNYFQVKAHHGTFPALLDKWREEYGDVYSYELFGETTIVISRYDLVKELLEHRSSIYSSRQDFPMLREFIHRDANIAFNLYGDKWRRLRRKVHEQLNIRQAKQYVDIQEREAHILAQGMINNLLKGKRDPNSIFAVASRFAGSISFGLLYDHRVQQDNDPLIHEWVGIMERKLAYFTPGSTLYDYLPYFRWLPEWILWSKKAARIARDEGEVLDTRLSNQVRDRMARGEDAGSFHAGLLESEAAIGKERGKAELTPFERDSLSGMMAVAAIETTVATVIGIVKALVCWPDVQNKVQAELDRVVGRERMPSYDDLLRLPYTQAFVRESMRWREIARFGVPHTSIKEDSFQVDGTTYFVEKGTVITGFVWALSHNKEMFPDYDTLRPERYIDSATGQLNNTPIFSFGFGRRVCIGQHLAQTSTELAAATLAWGFNLKKARDERGQEIEIDTRPEAVRETGTIFTALPFPFVAEARFPNVEKIVQQTAALTT